MGVRITGISTPVGGITCEYTKAEERTIPLLISPGQKIKVFISSICGVEKYDKVRIELKKAIESTQLADYILLKKKEPLHCWQVFTIRGHCKIVIFAFF